MRRFVTILALFIAASAPGAAALAEEQQPAETPEPAATEQQVPAKRTDNIIRVETVEDYWWHRDHFDPSVHYDIAPWLYDPFNLAREGGDGGKD